MTPADNQRTDATRPASRVGIIGGGQLGMLLCGAARDLGIHTIVLTDDATGPAVHTADELLVAPLDDQRAVSELIEKSEVITFELEAIPDVTLDSLLVIQGRDQQFIGRMDRGSGGIDRQDNSVDAEVPRSAAQ